MSSGTFWKFNLKNGPGALLAFIAIPLAILLLIPVLPSCRLDGIGVEFGEEGLLEYCHLQVIAAKR